MLVACSAIRITRKARSAPVLSFGVVDGCHSKTDDTGHTKAPEGTDGDLRSAGPEATNKSAVPGRRLVPRSPALRPANLVPGTVPRIAPRTGLAVQSAPSGKTKCTVGALVATTGLSTNLSQSAEKLSPNLTPLWTLCGYTRPGGMKWVV